MSRPTSLTPEVQARIIQALQRGCYLKEAAACAGVSYDSIREWRVRGRRGEEPFAAFAAAVKRAEAEAIEFHVGVLMEAAREGHWQASAVFLERKRPRDWGKRDPTRKAPITNMHFGSATEALRLLREMTPALEEQAALERGTVDVPALPPKDGNND